MKWWHVSLLLCCYGFFKEFRPSEPFISPYLTGHWKNFTKKQVNEEIYPVGTYVYSVMLVIVFLLTDLLRYKPVIIIGGLAGVVTWSMLIWGTTISEMQVLEVFYGLFMASEVAYYTYIYAKVKKDHYARVTSHTRTAFLLGKSTAGLASQLLVLNNFLDYLQLNYVTIVGVGIATTSAFFLPSVSQSIYFHRRDSLDSKTSLDGHALPEVRPPDHASDSTLSSWSGQRVSKAFQILYHDLIYAYTNSYVVKWSVWWALATCGYLQATSYSQILWQDVIDNYDKGATLYHGYVECIYSLLAAGVAFAIGYSKVKWELYGEMALGILTAIQGGCLLYAAFITELYLSYAVYMLYGILYQVTITLASSEVAKHIKEDSYALVFGVNTFFAVIIQTILTAIVINGLETPIRDQFTIYGSYYLLIGGGFLVAAAFTLLRARRQSS